jgi:hypothetical protein
MFTAEAQRSDNEFPLRLCGLVSMVDKNNPDAYASNIAAWKLSGARQGRNPPAL